MSHQVGFMQGRLSPIINGAIQSFPWNVWKKEVPVAKSIGLDVMEWTIDQKMLYENPLMTLSGQNEIEKICKEYNIPNEFIGHNVLVDGIEHFKGVVSRSNYNEYWMDINPSFKFELLCEKEH